jgi:N-acylneuraminate cytidylyltransferase
VNVAVIPARGGSKRIPRKNIRPFGGKPMIAHSIECVTDSGLFDRVIVSTDDREIGEVAKQYGAEVPFYRPAALSDDHAGTTEVVAHAVSWLHQTGVNPVTVCCVYATAPFLSGADLALGLDRLLSGSWRYVFAATDYGSPIFRSFQIGESGGIEMFFPEHFNTRSQDLPDALHDAGQFYWGSPQAWLDGARVFDAQSTVVRIPRWRVHDIDTIEDWERAELFLRVLQTSGER